MPGFDPKISQAHKIISEKIGEVEQHLAHFRLAKANADGRYLVEVAPLPDGQEQFLLLCCCPSRCTRTFQTFYGLASVDAAHLKGGAHSQLFRMTT